MAIDYELLGRIHGLLKQQTDLKERLQRGPRRIQMVRNNEASFQKAFEDAKNLARQTHMAIDQKQLQLGEREAKIKDLNFRLNTCESNKEFQLLKDRIAADQQANSVLQDEILEMLERLDVMQAESVQAKANYEKAQADAVNAIREIEREIESMQQDLKEVESDLQVAEKKLTMEVLPEYRRKIKGLQENVLGQTDGENCGNCYQRLTAQMAANIQLKKAVFCQGCGCLLYSTSFQPTRSE